MTIRQTDTTVKTDSEAGISRRDFVGNTIVGGSAALLAVAAPNAFSEPVDFTKTSNFKRKMQTVPWGLPWSHEEAARRIAGKRVWYKYAGGYAFEQHYIDEEYIVWRGVDPETGKMSSYEQKDRYHCFEIRPGIYVIVWAEESTIANDKQLKQFVGPWPVFVVADFNRLVATVSFTNPDENGKGVYIIDQAQLEIKEG